MRAARTSFLQRARRGSVLIIVMVTLVFTAYALIAFMEKASNDLLVEQRDATARRLRREAYSALEVTLAVLEDFRVAGNGLRSPAEGWGDPLGFAGYEPSEGRRVEITFEDESGKVSLPRANANVLSALFKNWDVTEGDADELADALMGWMKKEHIYSTSVSPRYEQGEIPYVAPMRPVRSYDELAAIEKVRDTFYDEDGRPNERWLRFVDSISLFDFSRPNINGAKRDTLAAVGQYDDTQQREVLDYLQGTGGYASDGPRFFQNNEEAAAITGPSGSTGGFAATISALRIHLTVHEGKARYRLSVVVTPQGGGASIVQANATTSRAELSAANNPPAQQQQQQQPNPNNRQSGNTPPNLRYPFTLLEIRENDEIAPSLPSPAP